MANADVVGLYVDKLVGRHVPIDRSLIGRAYTTQEALRLSAADELAEHLPPISDMGLGPLLVVPLVGSQRVHGVLTLARKRGRPSFTAEDLDMATGFANQAALALELAEARAKKYRLALFAERDRIAADLHDQVIQRLFGTGLALQSVAAVLGPGKHTERILGAISDLDDTISQIRTTIFSLSHVPDSSPTGLRARILEVVADVSRALGFCWPCCASR